MELHTDVRAYYVDKWGEPDREAVFEVDSYSVGVLKWKVGEATFYATLGGSDLPAPGHGDKHGREYFIALDPELDDIASPLAWLVVYTRRAGRSLEAGHIYRATEDLATGTDFAGFLFVEPLPIGPSPIRLPDERIVDFVMAIPVSRVELDYASKYGPAELWAEMASVRTPYWDPHRRSVI